MLKLILFFGVLGLALAGVTDPICENDDSCTYPSCTCPSTDPPKNSLGVPIPVDQLPQMILLSFDDAVTELLYSDYFNELFNNRFNPNGCPISATFYLSHEFTDYTLVHELVQNSFEIGSHSFSHNPPPESWRDKSYDDFAAEMAVVRETYGYFGAFDPAMITGARSPFLQSSGNEYYRMLADNNFTYDCTRPTRRFMYDDVVLPEMRGLWPYTYDFDYASSGFLDCQIEPCPDGETFPGLWQVPMVDLLDNNGVECAMLDQCDDRPDDYEAAKLLLYNNFYARYDTNRTPLGLYTHASWFLDVWEHNYRALIDFLDEVLSLGDVYVLNVNMLVEWMKNPVPIGAIDSSYEAWCPNPPSLPPCQTTRCVYPDTPVDGQERIMMSCVACPPNYPSVDNPFGR